jgi:hypothetical protein
MSAGRFFRIVFWIERSSSEASALDSYWRITSFLAVFFAGLLFFTAGNPGAHVVRYVSSAVLLLFFFRALVLSFIESISNLASVDGRRSYSILCFVTMLILSSYGVWHQDPDFMVGSFVCLAALTTAWSESTYARALGFLDVCLGLVSLAFAITRPDPLTVPSALLCMLAAYFLLSRTKRSVERV